MTPIPSEDTLLQESISNSRRIVRSLKSKADAKRTFIEKAADRVTTLFGSMHFLVLNIIIFALWLLINTEVLLGFIAFDPFPFGLLTTIVSLEAIILAIFVLISQNRAAQVDDLRDEIDLQVDIITEQELTKLLRMTTLLLEKNGIDISKDKELASMMKPTNVGRIEKRLEKQIDN